MVLSARVARKTAPRGGFVLLLLNSSKALGHDTEFHVALERAEGVVTFTKPEAAPEGTVVMIKELETTVKTAAVPLNATLVVPVRLVPRILTWAPTRPEAGSVSTNR
jgi:hypothetical protein